MGRDPKLFGHGEYGTKNEFHEVRSRLSSLASHKRFSFGMSLRIGLVWSSSGLGFTASRLGTPPDHFFLGADMRDSLRADAGSQLQVMLARCCQQGPMFDS